MSAAAAGTTPARILVVDDQKGVRDFLTDALRLAGFEVDRVADGLEALERLAAGRYDLVLSDLRMPNMDGAELYREAERRWPGVGRRILFVSASVALDEYAPFLEAVRPPVLEKPFGLDALLGTVQRMLAEPAAR